MKVSTADACPWTTQSSAAWVAIRSGASGAGPGEIRYRVGDNASFDSRTATIRVEGQLHAIEQRGESPKPVEVDGNVASLSGSCPHLRFTIDGTLVLTDANTSFVKMSCGDMRIGIDLEVKGIPRSDGSILALKVERD